MKITHVYIFFKILIVDILFLAVFQTASLAESTNCLPLNFDVDCFSNTIIGLEDINRENFLVFKPNCATAKNECNVCIPSFFQKNMKDGKISMLVHDGNNVDIENVKIGPYNKENLCGFSEVFVTQGQMNELLKKSSNTLNAGILNKAHVVLAPSKLSKRVKLHMSHYENIVLATFEKSPLFEFNRSFSGMPENKVWDGSDPMLTNFVKNNDISHRYIFAIYLSVVKDGTDVFRVFVYDQVKAWQNEQGYQPQEFVAKTKSWNREGPEKVKTILKKIYISMLYEQLKVNN